MPEHTHDFQVLERSGIRIGVIGLVEKSVISDDFISYLNIIVREWIGTVSAWPPNFQYKDMAETGKELSKILRDPKGEYRCEIIIALTHARYNHFVIRI